jgi:putative oxidoreductase
MKAIILIRIAVGLIFVSEGIQKFLFPELRGFGRFVDLGIIYPEFTSYLVAYSEIICGTLILIGLVTRLAAIPLFIIMLVAITLTKILLIPEQGFWEVAHGARTDFAMLLSSLFLIFAGSGKLSLDESRSSSAD